MADWVPITFSIVATLFGIVATALMGMSVNKLNGINAHLERLNGQFFAHVTSSNLHEAGLVRLEEQVKNVLAIAKVAHERADRLEESVHGKS